MNDFAAALFIALLPCCWRGSPLEMAPDYLDSSDGMFTKYCRSVSRVHMVERPFKTFGKGRRLDKLSITKGTSQIFFMQV